MNVIEGQANLKKKFSLIFYSLTFNNILNIIVMVILAGVIITSAVADGGIIERAQKAMKENERAEVEDLVIASYVYKTTASTSSVGHLNLEETAKAIYLNLTDNNFKLKTSSGQDVTDYKGIYSEEATSINLNVEGKYGSYEGTVEKTGLKDGMKIIEENDLNGGNVPGGNGTALEDDNNPLTIGAIEDLVELALTVNAGNSYENQTVTLLTSLDFNSADSYRTPNPEDAKYTDKDGNEVDINEDGTVEPIMKELTTGLGFMPIGKEIGVDEETEMSIFNSFKGIFDGNEKIISNLYINRPQGLSSLFLGAGAGTTIQNLTIENPEIYGIFSCGIVISMDISGQASDVLTIKNCNVSGGKVGAVTESCVSQNACGLAYVMSMGSVNFINNSNSSSISGATSCGLAYLFCGGGSITVDNCINNGNIIIEDKEYYLSAINDNGYDTLTTGCVVTISPNSSTVTNCTNYGTLNEEDGSLTGIVEGTGVDISNCTNYGTLTSSHSTNYLYVSGIYYDPGYDAAEDCEGSVESVINYGDISVSGESLESVEVSGIAIINNEDRIFSSINKGNISISGNTAHSSSTKIWAAGVNIGEDNNVFNCINYGNINNDIQGRGFSVSYGSGISHLGNEVINCVNYGDISANYSAGIAYDLSNYVETHVYNCYNMGDLVCYYDSAGISVNGIIKNSYNLGTITSQHDGYTKDSIGVGGTSTNCYSLDGKESVDEKKELLDSLNANIGENTDWSKWEINENINNGYPIFSWQNVE